MSRTIIKKEFDAACSAVWTEIEFQNSLALRTDDEAKDIPGSLTLLRRYIRKVEDDWSDRPGVKQNDGSIQVSEALDGLRKLSAISMRSMIYNGIRSRNK